MGMGYVLAGFAVSQVMDGGGELVAATLKTVFDDPAAHLPKALDTANQRAWQTLELALQRHGGLLARINHLPSRLLSRERDALAGYLSAFLDEQPLQLPDQAAAERALGQLRDARERGLLALAPGRDPADPARLQRYHDQTGLQAAARATVADMAVGLRNAGYSDLAAVLEVQPPRSPPLLVTAFAWFFQRQVESDPALARGLHFEQLQQLGAAQARGLGALEQGMALLGDELQTLLGELAGVKGSVDRLDLTAQAIQRELQRQGSGQQHIYQLLLHLLSQADAAPALVKPGLSCSLHGEQERALVKQLIATFRGLPEEQRTRMPAFLDGLAKVQMGLGDDESLRQAEAAFDALAQRADNPRHRAQGAYNAWRAALERRDWPAAQGHIEQAMALDPALSPFPPGKFQLQAILGAGGFGVALRCRRVLEGDDVVIKALYPDEISRPLTQVFAEYARLKPIPHPALIALHDYGYVDWTSQRGPYIEMEWFDGRSLADWLRGHGRLSLDQALALFPPVIDAMRKVHAEGLLHRDLTPDNLLLRPDGDGWALRIIDFGLAYRLEAAGGQGRGNTVIGRSLTGKWDYAPPEQITGGKLGPYSDVYTFGKTVCKALFDRLSPNRRDWRTIPNALALLLEDCIDEAIEHRPADFDAVAARLAAWRGEAGAQSADAPRPAEEAPTPEAAPRPAKTSRKASPAPDLLTPVDLHGWPAQRVRERQRATAAWVRDEGLLDPETTRWVDDISYCNRLADGGEGPQMVIIPSGRYLMGGPDGEEESFSDERPQHLVTIARPFAMACYASSFDEYDCFVAAMSDRSDPQPAPPGLLRRLLGAKPEPPQVSIDRPSDDGWGRASRPVINVSWEEVVAYAQWLSEQTGKHYRLPSEAEWEYAARAGTTTPFWWGETINTDQANYDGNYTYGGGPEGEYRQQTLPVDRFEPNPWGLYQVHGNVYEWLQDCWNDSYKDAPDDGSAWEQGNCGRRLLRGGSWFLKPWRLRSAYRFRFEPGGRGGRVGVRLAQDLSL